MEDMINKTVIAYSENFTSPESDLLYQLNRQTHLRTFYPNMLSGKVQGKFLEMLVFMIKPENILEIGTFTGYSSLSMASALPEDGNIFTIEFNEEIVAFAKEFFEKSDKKDKIHLIQGDALEIIPKLNKKFDLVFIDADKEQYINYYSLVFPKVKKGGYILADNVLWGGKAVLNIKKPDKETLGIRAFNEYVKEDSRVEQVMLTVRDGLFLIRKISD